MAPCHGGLKRQRKRKAMRHEYGRLNGVLRHILLVLVLTANVDTVMAGNCTVTFIWPSDWATCSANGAYYGTDCSGWSAIPGASPPSATVSIDNSWSKAKCGNGDCVDMSGHVTGGTYTVYLTKSGCAANGPPQYTNYYANFCITNRLGTPAYPNVIMHFADNTVAQPSNNPDGSPLMLAPNAVKCFTLTNAQYFYVTYGDTLFSSEIPQTTLPPTGTNTGTANVPNQNSGIPGTATQNGVTGGPGGNAATGTNAVGGSSSLTQLDLNRAADAIIHSQGQNTARLVAELESLRTNSTGATAPDYSGLLGSIKTNTSIDSAASLRMDLALSNAIALATMADNEASNRVLTSVANTSNALASIQSSLDGLKQSGVTSAVDNIKNDLTGTPPTDYGVIRVTNGVTAVQEIDLGSALSGASLNPYLGIGWRGWLRTLLVWLMTLAAILWYADSLRQAMVDISAASQFQINSNASGAFSLVPGANYALRYAMVLLAISFIAFLPSLALALATTLHQQVVAETYLSGSLANFGVQGTGAHTAPDAIRYAWTSLCSWLPFRESLVIMGNIALARFLLNPAVGGVCLFLKFFGI